MRFSRRTSSRSASASLISGRSSPALTCTHPVRRVTTLVSGGCYHPKHGVNGTPTLTESIHVYSGKHSGEDWSVTASRLSENGTGGFVLASVSPSTGHGAPMTGAAPDSHVSSDGVCGQQPRRRQAERAARTEPTAAWHGGCVQVSLKTVVSHNAAPIGLSRTTRTASLST